MTQLLKESIKKKAGSTLRARTSLRGHIAFVPYQDLVDVHVGVLLDLPNPISDRFEGTAVRHVIDQQDTLCSPEVRGGDSTEAFLSGRVPNLQFDPFAVYGM